MQKLVVCLLAILAVFGVASSERAFADEWRDLGGNRVPLPSALVGKWQTTGDQIIEITAKGEVHWGGRVGKLSMYHISIVFPDGKKKYFKVRPVYASQDGQVKFQNRFSLIDKTHDPDNEIGSWWLKPAP